jgi:hypothetical protein
VLGEDIEPSSDDIMTSIPTLMEPTLLESDDPAGVVIHIDDCLCTFCEENRGIVRLGSTLLIEISDAQDTMMLRLLPEEAIKIAKALLKHSTDLEEMTEQGVWDYI